MAVEVLLIRKDSLDAEGMTIAELEALRPTLNYLKHNGDDQHYGQLNNGPKVPVKREATDEEQAAADAAAIVEAERQAKEQAIASIYAPVEYNGKLYPADLQSIAKYEVAKQAKGRGRLAKGIAIAVDGTPLKLSSAAEIDDFHTAMETAITARIEAVHDAL